MKNSDPVCPICGMKLDDNHFMPTTFPGIDQDVCCNCEENLGLMFTNFELKPGYDHGYIDPDYSDRLEKITKRTYLENRLIFFQDVLDYRISEEKTADPDSLNELREKIEKIRIAIKCG